MTPSATEFDARLNRRMMISGVALAVHGVVGIAILFQRWSFSTLAPALDVFVGAALVARATRSSVKRFALGWLGLQVGIAIFLSKGSAAETLGKFAFYSCLAALLWKGLSRATLPAVIVVVTLLVSTASLIV